MSNIGLKIDFRFHPRAADGDGSKTPFEWCKKIAFDLRSHDTR